MNFHEWINAIIAEWLKTGRSETQLAVEIGIGQATLNAMKNKTRGIPKEKRVVDTLINYFKDTHPEVYEVLGVPRPDPYSVLEGLPVGFIEATIAAHSEYIETITAKGISEGSPEAVKISKEILEKHGIHFTDTE